MMSLDPRAPIGPIRDLPRTPQSLTQVAGRMEDAVRAWRTLLSAPDGTPLTGGALLARRPHPQGWSVAQLAHHTADAHVHGLNRLRYALTTPGYVVQPFNQDAWLTLPDAALPVSAALALLDAANVRWAALLRGLDAARLDTHLTHPHEGEQDLWRLVAKHDWHLRHHLAQAQLAAQEGG
ncbi:DinB family protein [Deinococcus taeanensis]|uniref:DinB family protein n=1 Tax=Deinococcus taeanensis TaxID=2737050 RepID=UPI001CDB9652|nr:DinB family protein [Deinococcus taeanensis]UBV42010.1 DinB family protein [Deinococcus taeanensis]